jgi:predicted RNase H-like HicB family nuclease
MKFFSFEVVIEKEADGDGYYAYSPTLPGCFSNGGTIEEAKRNIREAIQQHLEALRLKNIDIPQSERIVHVEEISVGLP